MNYKQHKNITIRLELFLVTNDLLILEVCLVMQKRDQKKWLYKRVLQSSLKGRARAIMCSPNCFHFNQFIFSFSKNSSRFVSSIRNKEITGFLHPHLGCHWYARGQFGRASVSHCCHCTTPYLPLLGNTGSAIATIATALELTGKQNQNPNALSKN